MIARDVEITDLRPDAWKNLLSLVDISRIADVRPVSANLLSVLHHGGKVLRVYAPAGFRVPAIEQVDDPQELAKKLYYQLPGLDSVQILEKDSLVLFSDRAQRADWISNDLEDFIFKAYALAEQDPAGPGILPAIQLEMERLLDGVRSAPGLPPGRTHARIFWGSPGILRRG